MKLINQLLVICALWTCFAVKTEAAETTNIPKGFLIGDNRGISISKNGSYFFDLENLLPGDTITRNLVIQNNRDDDYELKLEIEPKSTKGPVDLIEKMDMTFTSGEQLIYRGNLVRSESARKEAKTVIDFGLIKAGSKRDIAIELHVKTDIPWEAFNAGESEAVVTWVFKAMREPISTKPGGKLPQTGEQSVPLSPFGWSILYLVIILSRVRRRANR